jgi:hypothetical protein
MTNRRALDALSVASNCGKTALSMLSERPEYAISVRLHPSKEHAIHISRTGRLCLLLQSSRGIRSVGSPLRRAMRIRSKKQICFVRLDFNWFLSDIICPAVSQWKVVTSVPRKLFVLDSILSIVLIVRVSSLSAENPL